MPSKKLAWGITGAGHHLRDTLVEIEELLKQEWEIDIYLSAAGETVIKMYNLLKSLETLKETYSNLNKIIYDKGQAPGYPICSRFNLHFYQYLVISPLTANSAAKMNVGIADTLITNIFSQMIKGSGTILLMPCDLIAGKITTEAPDGSQVKITIDEFNSNQAKTLIKFPNVSVFATPAEIKQQILNS